MGCPVSAFRETNMPDPAATGTFLPHLKDVLAFLATAYGLLAGFTVTFPLSASLLKFLPVRRAKNETPPGLMTMSPGLVLTVSSLGTLFVLLQVIAGRESLRRMPMGSVRLWAAVAFFAGVFCLFAYTSLYRRVTVGRPRPAVPGAPDPPLGYASRDALLLVLHSAAFAAFTFAFSFILYKEYLSQEVKKEPAPQARSMLAPAPPSVLPGP